MKCYFFPSPFKGLFLFHNDIFPNAHFICKQNQFPAICDIVCYFRLNIYFLSFIHIINYILSY